MYVRLAPSDFRYFSQFFFHHHFFDFQLLNPLFILLFSDLNVRIWVIVIFHEHGVLDEGIPHPAPGGERGERGKQPGRKIARPRLLYFCSRAHATARSRSLIGAVDCRRGGWVKSQNPTVELLLCARTSISKGIYHMHSYTTMYPRSLQYVRSCKIILFVTRSKKAGRRRSRAKRMHHHISGQLDRRTK